MNPASVLGLVIVTSAVSRLVIGSIKAVGLESPNLVLDVPVSPLETLELAPEDPEILEMKKKIEKLDQEIEELMEKLKTEQSNQEFEQLKATLEIKNKERIDLQGQIRDKQNRTMFINMVVTRAMEFFGEFFVTKPALARINAASL